MLSVLGSSFRLIASFATGLTASVADSHGDNLSLCFRGCGYLVFGCFERNDQDWASSPKNPGINVHRAAQQALC